MAEGLRKPVPAENAFEPRLAALAHAGDASRQAKMGSIDEVAGEGVNAVACGLVYVGDQILRLATLIGVALTGVSEDDTAAITEALNGKLRAPAPDGPRYTFDVVRPQIRGRAIAVAWDKITPEIAERIPVNIVGQIVDDTLAVAGRVVEENGGVIASGDASE